MKLAINAHNMFHPAIATSLCNIGLVHEGMGELNKAKERLEESLEVYLKI